MQEFAVLYCALFMDYQNSFDSFLSGGSTDATCKVWCKKIGQIIKEEFEKLGFEFVVILRIESYRKSGRGLHLIIQLN